MSILKQLFTLLKRALPLAIENLDSNLKWPKPKILNKSSKSVAEMKSKLFISEIKLMWKELSKCLDDVLSKCLVEW